MTRKAAPLRILPGGGLRIGYVMDAGAPDVRPPASSGPARHVRAVIEGLGRLGHDVRLLARWDDGLWVSDDLAVFRAVGVPALDAGFPRLAERAIRRTQRQLRAPYVGWFDSRRFAAACTRELSGVDVIYERLGWMGLGGRLAARAFGVPHVLEVNGDHLFELDAQGMAPGGLQRRVSLRLMGRLARDAAWTIATGPGWRDRHVERWGVNPATVSVVPNGTEMLDHLARGDLRCFGRASDDGPLRVIFAGAFDAWQGLPVILRATARARMLGADLTLTLAGSGPLEAEVRDLVSSLSLGSVVTLAGHLSPGALADRLRESDVGVAAYCGRGEYSGLKLLDYKAAGLAVVTTGRDGRPAEIADGRTGLVVLENDAYGLAGALARCAADRSLTRRFGAAARAEAEARHAWRETARQVGRRLSAVVAARPRRAPARPAPATSARAAGISVRQG
ncbi:MAG: glycosyltransferase family 4 protein [Vicinamibacterales bacterium]